MNLWLRLLYLLVMERFWPRLNLPQDTSVLHFRVWPHDLDLSVHMNNGRYLTLMDQGRMDIIVRSGLGREVWRNGWTPIASAISIRFRRELRPFQRMRLETRLICWDDTLVVMEQTFLIEGGSRDGQVASRGLFKGGIYDRKAKAFVPTKQLMHLIGVDMASPEPTPEVDAFLHADEQLKQATRS